MRFGPGIVLLLAGLCAGGDLARARAPGTPPKKKRKPPARLVVLVASQAQGQVARQVARAVRNHLVDLRVRFRLRWVKQLPAGLRAQVMAARRLGSQEQALVVLWCSHATVDQVFLYITRFKGGRILVRQVDRARDGTLGRFEAIGAIVRSGVEAILKGARIGIRPPPPPSPPRRRRPSPAKPRPRQARPKARALGISLDLGYSMTGFAPQEPLLHAGSVGLSVTLHRHWALRLGYRFAPSVRAQDAPHDIDLRIFQHALDLGGVFRWPLGRWTLALQAAAVLSVQTWSASAPAPLRSAPDGLDLTAGLEVLATVSWRARPWLAVYGGIGATALLWNRSYDAHVGGERPRILEPFPVQPHLVVGLRFDIF